MPIECPIDTGFVECDKINIAKLQTVIDTLAQGICPTDCPNLTQTINASPTVVVGQDNQLEIRIVVSEINGFDFDSDIIIEIPKSSHYVLSYDPSMTTAGGLPVLNTDWQFTAETGQSYIFTYIGTPIPANGVTAVGINASASANGDTATEAIQSTILDTLTGLCSMGVNSDFENIDYSP